MYISEVHQVPCSIYEKYVTIYRDPDVTPRVSLLYFHGGGLLYGSREDLPEIHKNMLTAAGCVIWAFDYPLAPAAKLDLIFDDAVDSANFYISHAEGLIGCKPPYVLWGRSAGAMLALIVGAKGSPAEPPSGVVSFYGYGFLEDNWYCYPSPHYLKLMPVDGSLIDSLSDEITGNAPLEERYMVYIYARQSGKWKDLIYSGRDKFFYMNYSLRLVDSYPCPLFAAHSTGDTDVPYVEFTELCAKYNPTRFISTSDIHDFDRNEDDVETANCLRKMIAFLGAEAPEEAAETKEEPSQTEKVSLTCTGCSNACSLTAEIRDGILISVIGGCHYSVRSARKQLKNKLLQDSKSMNKPVTFLPAD